jgi:hypothetical protein
MIASLEACSRIVTISSSLNLSLDCFLSHFACFFFFFFLAKRAFVRHVCLPEKNVPAELLPYIRTTILTDFGEWTLLTTTACDAERGLESES